MLAKHNMRTNPGDIVNMLMQVETCELAILFREQDKDSVHVSLRATDKVDATEIARRFGGGGYPRTAGCVLRRPLSETVAQVLSVARQTVSVGDHQEAPGLAVAARRGKAGRLQHF
jgi:phosphoesterase RecJ-like protein